MKESTPARMHMQRTDPPPPLHPWSKHEPPDYSVTLLLPPGQWEPSSCAQAVTQAHKIKKQMRTLPPHRNRALVCSVCGPPRAAEAVRNVADYFPNAVFLHALPSPQAAGKVLERRKKRTDPGRYLKVRREDGRVWIVSSVDLSLEKGKDDHPAVQMTNAAARELLRTQALALPGLAPGKSAITAGGFTLDPVRVRRKRELGQPSEYVTIAATFRGARTRLGYFAREMYGPDVDFDVLEIGKGRCLIRCTEEMWRAVVAQIATGDLPDSSFVTWEYVEPGSSLDATVTHGPLGVTVASGEDGLAEAAAHALDPLLPSPRPGTLEVEVVTDARP
jgi:hypothetical protein